MNLLETLMGAMTSGESLAALTQQNSATDKQVTDLLGSALPALMSSMEHNASTQEGANSLLYALGQHTNTAPVAQQIAEADKEDGSKIIAHILGGNKDFLINGLSDETGLQSSQVSSILSSIAPALMSGVSTSAAKPASKKEGVDLSDGLDLKDVMALLGSGSSSKKGGILSLLKNLF